MESVTAVLASARVTDVVPRLATPADNAACLKLFSQVPMRGELVLSTRREPDFFALYAMQRARAYTYVGEDAQGLLGMATALVRDGWLDGRVQKVGYLGDLRVRFDRSRAFGRLFGDHFDALCAEAGCRAYYTSVLASNRAALNALVKRSPKRRNQPYYHPLHRFSAVSVQLTRRRSPSAGVPVRSATADDVPKLTALLADAHQRRPFGYRFDDGEFQHRLAHWPGFTLDDTLVAHGPRSEVLGVATLWDPAPVKRFQVHAYNGAMKWVQRGFNLVAAVARWPRLPPPGGEFRYVYLANLAVRDESPRVFRALLEHAYARLQPTGRHFFTFELDDGDPLAPALAGFTAQRLDFQLFAVSPASDSRTDWPAGRTGFEIALA